MYEKLLKQLYFANDADDVHRIVTIMNYYQIR
jgi:hypothetical protein